MRAFTAGITGRSLQSAALLPLCLCVSVVSTASANPPMASYIFPAGGQRGTTVDVRVGGLFLHDSPVFGVTGPGITHSPRLAPAKRVWFEGPLIPIPESQAQEDYPADMRGKVSIATDAAPGARRVHVFTAQGGAGGPVFVVGDLPELIEKEIDGEAIPESIALPVTVNGRIFPREDIDLWEFDAQAGVTVTAYVHAPSIRSPLAARLEILDAKGNVIAEQMRYACVGTDCSVAFTPRAAGKYRVRIADARALGGPAYVYRLTVTAANVPAFHFPLRTTPDGLEDAIEPRGIVSAPVAINGRIPQAGATNEWKVALRKGAPCTLDLVARRAESPLCGVVRILDAAGKELARTEAGEVADPAAIPFTPPADGVYTVTVAEKFRGRGGPNFVYRLRLADGRGAGEPGFRLTVPAELYNALRGGTIKVKVVAERSGGFAGPILVTTEGLPSGVAATGTLIPAKQNAGEITLTVAPGATIQRHSFRIHGTGVAGLQACVRATAFHPGSRSVADTPDLGLVVTLPTPFKIVDEYVMTSAPRGETYHRKYRVDRGGFDGPITVQLAEKQARHLQGVTGPVLILRPGETEFTYPAFLPPWMELGRTCRVCVMATARIRDPLDGREHAVSFSSVDQNQQMIVVVAPGRLDVALEKTSIRAEGEVRLAVKVARSKSLIGAARIEAILPGHWKGVSAAPLTIPADGESGELVLSFARDCGPFNAPLVIRATVQAKGTPVTAEAKVDVVP